MSRTTRQTRSRTTSTPLATKSVENEETVSPTPTKLKDGLAMKKRKKNDSEDIVVITTTSTRTSSRRRTVANESNTNEIMKSDENDHDNNEDENEEGEDNDELETTQFTVNGVIYNTYQEMVQAKRQRNQKMLQDSGLLSSVSTMKEALKNNRRSTNGIKGLQAKTLKERSTSTTVLLPPRKSSRLAGIVADNLYVDKERGNTFEFGGFDSTIVSSSETAIITPNTSYNNRINDGSSLTISDIVSLTGSKWCKSNSISLAETFASGTLRNEIISSSTPTNVKQEDEIVVVTSPINSTSDGTRTSRQRKTITPSPTLSSSSSLMDESNNDIYNYDSNNKKFRQYFPYTDTQRQQVLSLSCNDENTCSFAKVVPERIYGIAVHPSKNNVIVSAGDKVGHIGIWNVDHVSAAHNDTPTTVISNDNINNDTTSKSTKTDSDGVYLFKYHSGAAVSLQWTDDGSALVSTSYDGTIRWFDIEKQISEQIFATYDDNDDTNKNQLGYGLHMGYKFWTQYGCIDHRSTCNKCLFVSTSIGTVLHLDLRTHDKQRITFHEDLSEKKINTVSLHPNGYSLMTGGLDNTVRVWDIRKFGDSRLQTTTSSKKKTTIPVSQWQCSKSISSSYFSPSGQYSVATTMDDKLEIFENIHLSSSTNTNNVKPVTRYSHDNRTGRWLSTFMANYHPSMDIFVVGSMMKPRSIDLFDHTGSKCISKIQSLSGDNLSAVNSRCCFHPRTDKIIIAGGNSSGRVTVV